MDGPHILGYDITNELFQTRRLPRRVSVIQALLDGGMQCGNYRPGVFVLCVSCSFAYKSEPVRVFLCRVFHAAVPTNQNPSSRKVVNRENHRRCGRVALVIHAPFLC
ncbi:Uncharacterized protein Fot_35072 [Forsythia ovata]|uniref:Uncharacterized protein n=1 Tax=Forsythia ovata TaxID=205694 RepID=A0ABD1SLY6_9LAMI